MNERIWMCLVVIGFTGCATAPQRLLDKEASLKHEELRYHVQNMKQGSFVSIKFYDHARDLDGSALPTTRIGYFDTYQKMNDVIFVAKTEPSWLNRGDAYYLKDVEAIEPIQAAAPAPAPPSLIVQAVQDFVTVDDHDPERQLLTQ